MGERLVDARGRVRIGVFDMPIDEVDAFDYPLRDPFGRRVSALRRRLALNRFHFLGALSEPVVFGCAVAHLGVASSAFVHFHDPASGEHDSVSFVTPLGLGCRFPLMPERGRVSYRRGRDSIELAADGPRRRLAVELRRGVSIDALFDEDDPPSRPMRLCTRAGASGWVFARKSAGGSVRGSFRWGDRRIDLGAAGARGHADWTAGFMRRHTFWNWGCLSGVNGAGRVLGLNVSCGVNETSFSENCFWIDGRLEPLPGVHFDYDPEAPLEPWRLGTADGRLALYFEPQGEHAERRNALVLASNFRQLVGRYRGHLITADGERIEVDDLLGYAETHYARW